jgi:hypothetical protein
MCYEISFIFDCGRIYTTTTLDSHSAIRYAWNIPREGSECEWSENVDGTRLEVRHENAATAVAIRKYLLERWPTRAAFSEWLAGQETRKTDGNKTVFVVFEGRLRSREDAAYFAQQRRNSRHAWRLEFRDLRAYIYQRRFEEKKQAAAQRWSMRRLAREGMRILLADRMRTAAWGLQVDGTFVAVDNGYRTLHLPGNNGIIAKCGPSGSARIYAENEARATRAAARARDAEDQKQYLFLLAAAANWLMHGASLPYYSGQKGRYFVYCGQKLSANGVLKRVHGAILSPLPEGHFGVAYCLYDLQQDILPLPSAVLRKLQVLGEY